MEEYFEKNKHNDFLKNFYDTKYSSLKEEMKKNTPRNFKTKIIVLLKEEILIHTNKKNFSSKESLIRNFYDSNEVKVLIEMMEICTGIPKKSIVNEYVDELS
jgi:hypothetical protein